MTTTKTLLLCIMLTANALAAEQQQDMLKSWQRIQNKVQILEQQGCVIIANHWHGKAKASVFAVTSNHLLRTPQWDGENAPPLSMARAIALAKAYKQNKLEEGKQIKLSNVRLRGIIAPLRMHIRGIAHDRLNDRWIYMVEFLERKVLDGGAVGWFYDSSRGDMPVYVMMDGTVIEPKQMAIN